MTNRDKKEHTLNTAEIKNTAECDGRRVVTLQILQRITLHTILS